MHRTHVASAHRAAVCIYLSRVCLSLDQNTQFTIDLEILVTDIITNLSVIRRDDALFTATTWPAFIAGAETHDRASQEWVTRRFQELWEVEPWGLMRGALGVLERIWKRRRSAVVLDDEGAEVEVKKKEVDWIGDMRGQGVDWLNL